MHLSGHAGRLLRFSDGEMTSDLLRVVHPALRVELRAAIFRAEGSGEVTETLGVPVEIDGVRRAVDLRVAPTVPGALGSLLVIFTEHEPATGVGARTAEGEPEPAVRELERELEQSKGQLRDTVEQSDANQEELKASNEELQAMNEELRSSGEELETSREELQSINEELTTVNLEMKSKVDELARSNGDLQNLMAATQIATIFLDRQLCIERYTPPAVSLFNLIPTDVGRPLSDLTSRLRYPELATEAERVLETLAGSEREVSHPDGRTFLTWLRPYRTEEDRISGVVLTLVDITARKQGEEDMRESEARFRAVTVLVPDLLWISDTAGVVHWFNQRWYQYTGQTPTCCRATAASTRCPPQSAWERSNGSWTLLPPAIRTGTSSACAGRTGRNAGTSSGPSRCASRTGASASGSGPAPTSTTSSGRRPCSSISGRFSRARPAATWCSNRDIQGGGRQRRLPASDDDHAGPVPEQKYLRGLPRPRGGAGPTSPASCGPRSSG